MGLPLNLLINNAGVPIFLFFIFYFLFFIFCFLFFIFAFLRRFSGLPLNLLDNNAGVPKPSTLNPKH